MGKEKKKKTASSSSKELGEHVKVYLRLRPMDKFETAKRSKDCIQLHENPKLVTVDSPLQGNFDYTFDQVFDEYTPQIEVYKESISTIPRRLLSGISCAVMAYGQTGSGKTHTMLGEGLGIELNVRTLGLEDEEDDEMMNEEVERSADPRRNPEVTEGMIPRVIADLLDRLDDAPETVEFTIRCSFVEIYLEKVCDLLQPWREEVRIGKDEHGQAAVVGACEVCCLDVSDIYALLARGNAYRTKAATDQNLDSSRSHAVFTLRLETVDRDTGRQTSCRLLMLDLAGSETGKKEGGIGQESTTAEGKYINASLASLFNVVRSTLYRQGRDDMVYNEIATDSKLAQLLRPCFGDNWYTTMICTGSPSSYNINETRSTINFGQSAREVKNFPKATKSWTVAASRKRLKEAEKRQEDLTALVKMIAHECKHVKGRSKGKDSGNIPLWEVIEKIVSSTKPGDAKDIEVSIGGKDKATEDRILELEQLVEGHRLAREKAESGMRDMKSEITSLRRQKESIANEKKRMSRELHDAKEEIANLNQRNIELESLLRTSQFRERESISFLRQFRTFYFRLLRSKAAQGNGSTKDVTAEVSLKISGLSDLEDLLDVDRLMLDSGLIEESEMGSDTNAAEYEPSPAAHGRSEEQSRKLERHEIELINREFSSQIQSQSDELSIRNGGHKHLNYGQLAYFRQRLLESPAGRLAVKKEQELENQLAEMSKRIVTLQNSLKAEKAMVEALSARQGAMGKMKAAQELTTIKQEMERKTHDLHAIVWKMNELHLVNKTIRTKVESRESHVHYLEEHLGELQTQNRRLVSDLQETEQRFIDDNALLQDRLDGMVTQIWQLGDSDALPLWRIVVPYTGDQLELDRMDEDQEGRFSLGHLQEEDIDGLIHIVENNERD